ncbi:hypothetical protein [Promicromonospora soli]
MNATAWEAGATTGLWPWAGSAILALAAGTTIALYMADRIREPEATAILVQSRREQWDADRTDLEFFRALYVRVAFNENVLRTAYALTWVCVALGDSLATVVRCDLLLADVRARLRRAA